MYITGIRVHSPQTVAEALELLADLKNARILAGGTDILVDLKQGLTKAGDLISLKNIQELKGIEKKGKTIRIGAFTTPQEIHSNSLIRQHFPALAEAARSMASAQIRTLATIGGNITSAVPSADLPPSLIAADATAELRRAESTREIPLFEFFAGPRETVCRKEELLVSVRIPLPPPYTGISYKKFTLREANALAVASAASRLTLKNNKMEKVTVVLGAVAPTPVLAKKTAGFLQGKTTSQNLFEEAAALAVEEGKPISDIRGSAWFRKELIRVLTLRSLAEALERALGKTGEKKNSL
ncbi:MAG: xanthine dehydrogenase family protein subunit M [Candidatus Aminicenantes bacterium]|nr:xanthine dehydrogenase family protein subunit M [Candidatus Aminicenantes bacterium]MDH5706896.1 xanthine dehydrogenase family protein subunit M [Candidatus Aminicenantes bacterium]